MFPTPPIFIAINWARTNWEDVAAGFCKGEICGFPDGQVGVLKVRLFRPWSRERFMAALPKTTERICVLDRTKDARRAERKRIWSLARSIWDFGHGKAQ